MSHDNVELVDRFIAAVSRRDREAVAAVIHPEVEWRTMASPLLGIEAVREGDETLSLIFDRIPEGIEDFTATADRFTELPDGTHSPAHTVNGHGPPSTTGTDESRLGLLGHGSVRRPRSAPSRLLFG